MFRNSLSWIGLIFILVMLNAVYATPLKIYEVLSDDGVDVVHVKGNPFIPLADITAAEAYIDGNVVIVNVKLAGSAPSEADLIKWSQGELDTWDVGVKIYISDEDGNRGWVEISVGSDVYKYEQKIAVAGATIEAYNTEEYEGEASYQVTEDGFTLTASFEGIEFYPPYEDWQRFDIDTLVYRYEGQVSGGAQDSVRTKKALVTRGETEPPVESPYTPPESPETPSGGSGSTDTFTNMIPYIAAGVVIVAGLSIVYFKFLRKPP